MSDLFYGAAFFFLLCHWDKLVRMINHLGNI
jgi:hypothetical protein